MKIGDEVFVCCAGCGIKGTRFDGDRVVIWSITENPKWSKDHPCNQTVAGERAYCIEFEGVRFNSWGGRISYPQQCLRRIDPPGSWDELTEIVGTDLRKEKHEQL